MKEEMERGSKEQDELNGVAVPDQKHHTYGRSRMQSICYLMWQEMRLRRIGDVSLFVPSTLSTAVFCSPAHLRLLERS